MGPARASFAPGRFLARAGLAVLAVLAVGCGAGVSSPERLGGATATGGGEGVSNPVGATTVPTADATTSPDPVSSVSGLAVGTSVGSLGPSAGDDLGDAIVDGAVDTVGQAVESLAGASDAGAGVDAGDRDDAGWVDDAPVSVPGTSGWRVTEALAADSECSQPAFGRPLVIGYAADLGGRGAAFDEVGVAAAEHLARLINCSGGLEGTPVVVEVADVSGAPTASRDAAEELLEAGAVALIGPRHADLGLRVLQAADGRVPVVFATSTEPVLASAADLGFLVGVDDDRAASAAAVFARDQGWAVAATLSAPGPRFGSGPARFAAGFADRGGEVVGDVWYVVGETVSFAEQAAAVAALEPEPEVIYTTMPLDQVAVLKAALDEADVSAALVVEEGLDPVMASAGPIRLAGDGLDPASLDGVYVVAQAVYGSGERPSQFDGSVVIATGVRPANPTAAALVGDAMVLIADAFVRSSERVGAETLGEVILQTDDLKAITGTLNYKGRASPTKSVPIVRMVDGVPEVVTTIAAGR